MAKVVKVIYSEVTRGRGIEEDPFRMVEQWCTLKGVLLWERDRWAEQRERTKPTEGT